jgi:hypothetical protein
MTSITDIALGNIAGISEEYTRNIAEPSRALQKVAEDIRHDGKLIRSFERKELDPNLSMVAIDGGNASEKLAGGDLIVSGATLGEGINSRRLYASEDEIPSEVYSTIISHTSSNDKIEKSIRALLELRILAETKADIRIIDGAYLGNISSVLYALLDKDPRVSNAILEYAEYDKDGLLAKAMKEILYPSRTKDNLIIAVPKSDSSVYYINHMLSEYNLKDLGITDRMFASRVLNPGEFFTPRNIESNPGLVSSLSKTITFDDFGDKSSNKSALSKLVNDKAGLLRRLGQETTEEGLLWATYFKPSIWHEHSPVIKIEFLYHSGDNKETPEEKARQLIQIVDQDIVDDSIQEPWSQFHADRGAKQVSVAISILKNHILNNVTSSYEAAGMLKGYRT